MIFFLKLFPTLLFKWLSYERFSLIMKAPKSKYSCVVTNSWKENQGWKCPKLNTSKLMNWMWFSSFQGTSTEKSMGKRPQQQIIWSLNHILNMMQDCKSSHYHSFIARWSYWHVSILVLPSTNHSGDTYSNLPACIHRSNFIKRGWQFQHILFRFLKS